MGILVKHKRILLGSAHKNESGFVLAWTLVLLTVLLGAAGFAVDIGNWYIHVQRAQNAADSAALAGAVYLPEDPARAEQVARSVLDNNQVPEEYVAGAVIHPVTDQPAALYVRVTTTTQNLFLQFLSVAKTSTFQRAGTAVWKPALELANFSNVLGSEPEDLTQPFDGQWEPASLKSQQGKYWMSIAGPTTFKTRGDEYSSLNCESPDYGPGFPVDGCSGGVNTEYDSDGHYYHVAVSAGAPGNRLIMQAYDPAFVNTAGDCGSPEMHDLDDAGYSADPRYALWTNDFCAGDYQYYDADPVVDPPTTYMQVLDRKKQPIMGCPLHTFAPWIKKDAADDFSDNMSNPAFTAVFHQWVQLCDMATSVAGGDYFIHVWTDTNTNGINQFTLRAGLFSGTSYLQADSGNSIRISAVEHLAVYANFYDATAKLAITKVPQSFAGSDVEIDFFDIGDASDPGSLKLVSSSTASGGPTQSCSYTPLDDPANFHPLANCTLNDVYSQNGYDGRKLKLIWHVPKDYACGDLTTGSCYLFLSMTFPGGNEDHTTWSLVGDGGPVRLIPNPSG